MRRLIYLIILSVFVGASVTGVSASTDCERWFVAYRHELAHTRSLQRIAAAKRRAKQRLAGYIKPPVKPRLVPVVNRSPRMTPRETLHHFDLACGVLPETDGGKPLVAEEENPGGFNGHPLNDGVDLLPAPLGELIAENDTPPIPTIGNGGTDEPGGPSLGTPPSFGGGGVPPGGGSSTNSPPPPPPPVGVVPEPSSYVFMLTGVLGIAGEVRRRFKA